MLYICWLLLELSAIYSGQTVVIEWQKTSDAIWSSKPALSLAAFKVKSYCSRSYSVKLWVSPGTQSLGSMRPLQNFLLYLVRIFCVADTVSFLSLVDGSAPRTVWKKFDFVFFIPSQLVVQYNNEISPLFLLFLKIKDIFFSFRHCMLQPASGPGDLLDLLHPECPCRSCAGEPQIASSAGRSLRAQQKGRVSSATCCVSAHTAKCGFGLQVTLLTCGWLLSTTNSGCFLISPMPSLCFYVHGVIPSQMQVF